MTCYYPLKGYRSKVKNESGKRSIVFKAREGFVDMPVDVPCGQCIGCRLERSRQWAIRCVHEASLHQDNCFLTLTYNKENLPSDLSLNLKHYQDFMKRFRKKYADKPIRFFHCGEYGSERGRPHYHSIIFGFDFDDKKLWQTTRRGDRLYRSESLERLWPYGYSTIGDVTFESAAYVARYITKKVTGKQVDEVDPETGLKPYEIYDSISGEIIDRKPEYTTMSRRPGIASNWFKMYKSDVFPSDEVVLRGKKLRPPKYYDGLFEVEDPDAFQKIKKARKKAAKNHADNNTGDRLRVREQVKLAQIKSLTRDLS